MRIILSSTRKLHNQLLVLQLAHSCPYFMFLLSIYNFLSRNNLKHLSLNILDGLMIKYFLIQVALLLKVHQIKWFNDEILKGIYDELKDKSKGVFRNQANNGSKTIAPWTIAPRTIATQDNYPPDNCHLGQLASGQLPPNYFHLGCLPPGQFPQKIPFFMAIFRFFSMTQLYSFCFLL